MNFLLGGLTTTGCDSPATTTTASPLEADADAATEDPEGDGTTLPQDLPSPGHTTMTPTFYVAPDGDDSGPGTEVLPFATIQHAVDQVSGGGIVYLRGGVYDLDAPVRLEASGSECSPLHVLAYPGEVPVLDFASNPRHANPPQPRTDDSLAGTADAVGVLVTGDHWVVRGLTVRNAPYYGVRVYGSHNHLEGLSITDSKASGLEITGKDGFSPSYNLVVSCDSFHNFDPQTNGEDADGFGAKFDGIGPGNAFVGTRAWSNSDDGYDFWNAAEPVRLENAWAFDNGFNRTEWAAQISGGFQGDGIGFKLGQAAAEVVLVRVAAWGNKGLGLDENGNGSVGGVRIVNATLVNNAKNGNPLQISLNDGSPHTVINSVAFDVDGAAVTQFDSAVTSLTNSWDGVGVSAADFVSVDTALLNAEGKAARGSAGELPPLSLALVPSSALVDAGTDTGEVSFTGTAPDIGAFEQP